ncbi:hypothetical protein PDQ07_08255 [Bacillus cereus]|nr:hypothetical protein [Bacillus cereus]
MSKEIVTFDYKHIDDEMASFLLRKENNIKGIVAKAFTDLGKELYEAQKALAGKNQYDGVFLRWLSYMNYPQRTAYELINRYEEVLRIPQEQLEVFEALPITLSKKNSSKSSESTEPKRQAKQAVLNGEVKTLKEYRELEKELRQANEDKQVLGQLLTEERNKPSEVQYVKDTESEKQLRLYRERYGDISENVYRITNETEISGMVMAFSEQTRDLIKQYAFLKHYEGEFHALNRRSKAEYESTLSALRDFLNDVQRVVEYSKTSTFQSCI